MINLFFPYYTCGDNDRQKEIDLCLNNNLNNEFITKIIILIDDGSVPPCIESERISIHHIEKRPTYRLWLELTKQLSIHGVSVLCNSDIYFDDTIKLLPHTIKETDQFLALSRWELENGSISLHKNPHWSQDVWAVHTQAEFSNEMLTSLEFSMGVPRCDNKIAYIFAIRGWRVYNPCSELRSIHAHETQLRTYHKKIDDRIMGAIAYVYPKNSIEDEADINIEVWTKRSSAIKRVALNKAFERWLDEQKKEDSYTKKINTLKEKLLPATGIEAIDAMRNGKTIYSNTINFNVIENKGFIFFNNLYAPRANLKIESDAYHRKPNACKVAGLIPPVIESFASTIGIKPKAPEDINFWQYPCATEKQAYDNHKSIARHQHINVKEKIINTYLPLPWATYIDKKSFPGPYLARVKNLISIYKKIADDCSYTLKVHSVCQHIHWVRILNQCENIGITDLHLSHKDSTSEPKQLETGTKLALHGWPLIAVNYEIPERQHGLERKPINDRKWLASFIGAHMKHYRDDSRLQLLEAAKEYGRDDVLVDLGAEWHFNKIVYEEQVLNKAVSEQHLDEHQQKTYRYNSVLSDSKFSLCPEGAGPNTLRFWESIAVGTVPVVFSDDVAIFKESNEGIEILKNSILWKGPISESLFQYLNSLDNNEILIKQKNLIDIYETLRKNITYAGLF